MSFTGITYTFVNGTKADGSQVNTNFQDIINGLSDGSKDLNVNDITCASITTSSLIAPTSSTLDTYTIAGSTPKLAFKDTDCTESDDNAYITAQATDTGSGTEDIDVTMYQQVAGTATAFLTADADGSITIGDTLRGITLSGAATISTITAATSDTDKFIVSDSGVVKFRTGVEVLSDIGGVSATAISGTENYLAKFDSGGSSIVNSIISESGNVASISGNVSLSGATGTADILSPNGTNVRITAASTGGDYDNGSYIKLNNADAGGLGGNGNIEIHPADLGNTEIYHGSSGGTVLIKRHDGTTNIKIENDGDCHFVSRIGIGNVLDETPHYLLEIAESDQTLKTVTDFLCLNSRNSSADMDGTETSILWQQQSYNPGTTRNSGRLLVGTETDWTSVDSTIDSYMAFHTTENNSLSEKMRLSSSGVLTTKSYINVYPTSAGTGSYYLGSLTDLSHGITDYLPTDAFFKISPASATGGGAILTAATEQDVSTSSPFTMRGIIGSICNDGTYEPAFIFDGGSKSGTGYTSLVSGTDIAQFKNAGVEKLSIEYDGSVNTSEVYKVDGTQVVSNRVVDARIGDTPNSGDATTDGIIDAIQDALIAHGLMAAA